MKYPATELMKALAEWKDAGASEYSVVAAIEQFINWRVPLIVADALREHHPSSEPQEAGK